MRIVKSFLALLFSLAVAAVVAAVLALYLAGSGKSMPLLRAVAGGLGRTITGQRTEQLAVSVRVRGGGELSATARLHVRSEQAGRRYLYFLLNDGLQLRAVWRDGPEGARTPLPFYRLWLVTVVALPEPLAADATVGLGFSYHGDPRTARLHLGTTVFAPDEIIVAPDALWYPSDLQGFFTADVELTAPADLTVLHNGKEVARAASGRAQRVRWSSERPIAGLGLVAARVRESNGERDGRRYRVALPDGVDLADDRVLTALASSDRVLTELYGPSGFSQLTLYVSRALGRAYFDGSGVIGLPPSTFRGGDYGLGTIAHEVAHSWWGATVAGQWLLPNSGSEWLVEGFAELSSWLVLRAELGESAFTRRLRERGYDPQRPTTVAALSPLDNAFDPAARAAIYHKGGYVALMLRELLGEEMFANAARQFIERFRHRQAGERDVEQVFGEVAQKDLSGFFAAWVRGDKEVDVALEPQDGGAVARNRGTAPLPAALDLWRFVAGEDVARQEIAGDAVAPLGNAERLVLDPGARLADMYRGNNVFPRRDNPRAVAASARGELMVVYGEPYAWAPARIDHLDARGTVLHTWDFDRGVRCEPTWSADGTRVLAIEPTRDGEAGLVALQTADGSRRGLGAATQATATADALIVARGAQLLRIAGKSESTIAAYPGAQVAAPLASPDGSAIAYTVLAGRELDLRVIGSDGSDERLLLSAQPTDLRWRWAPDGTRLFAVLAGDWDWQLWELPLDGSAPRALVREAAAIANLAVAPDGLHVAVIAAAALDYANQRGEVFIIDISSGQVEHFDLAGSTAHSLTWIDASSLLLVASDPRFGEVPARRELRRLSATAMSAFP